MRELRYKKSMRVLPLLLALVMNDTPVIQPEINTVCAPPPPPGAVQIVGDINREAAAQFKISFEAADKLGPVEILIHSSGGDVDAGWDMARVILAAKNPVTCVVRGYAYSMAFYVLQYCPERVMTRESVLMAHEANLSGPMIFTRLTLLDLENMASNLRATNKALITPAAKRMGFNPEEFIKWIHGRDWWISADDALKYKAVDRVIDL
jgi:ATP-dependent protease ClpP protease subunit